MADNVNFTGLDVPIDKLLPGPFSSGPMNLNWIRLKFTIGRDYSSFDKVKNWLTENCDRRWAAYQTSEGSSGDLIMVVRFEDKNDALMFKLRGGHQIWQE